MDLVVVGVEGLGDQVGVEVLVAGFASGGVEANAERGQPVLALLGQQRHHDRGVDATRQQHAHGHIGDHPAFHRGTQRIHHSDLPVADRPGRPGRVAAELGCSSTRCRRANRRAGSPAPLPAEACAHRGRSSSAPAPQSGRSCSGAARSGPVRCRRHRHRAAHAPWTRTAAARASPARYSGLMPSRSRASVTTPESRSAIANANMPLNRSTQRMPHLWNALITTSLSAVEKKR